MHVRWMIRRDMPDVLRIEGRSFEFPWSEEEFIRCLRQRNCIGMVVENDCDKVVGYMIYELHKTHLYVLNFAVDVEARRSGVGRAMIDKLKGKLSSNRRSLVQLMVRERNLAAQLFFKSCQFKAVSVIRQAYEDTDEDGYIMLHRLGNAEVVPNNRISQFMTNEQLSDL